MFDSRRRFLCACSGVLTLFPGMGRAADSWMSTHPEEWTPEDVQAILNRSSWVKGVNPELSPAWLRSLEKSGKRVAVAEGVRDKRTLTEFTVLVRWESGLPVRLARKSTSAPEYAAAHYVLRASSLQGGGKIPIPADRAEWAESDFEPRVMISFPQGSQPLESSDGVVTFVSQMGFLLD